MFITYTTHILSLSAHNTGYKIQNEKSSVYFLICSQKKWTCGLLLIIFAAQVHHRHVSGMAKHRARAETFSGFSYCHHRNNWARVTIRTFREVSSPSEVPKQHLCLTYEPHLITSPKGNVSDQVDLQSPRLCHQVVRSKGRKK
uniref:Uncharacterized protein n=1 Tax=Ixodes ricinus TaxID=34613 RepID=A0A6B0UTU3_IXORI